MENLKDQLLAIEQGKLTDDQMVSIMILIDEKLNIKTISKMARDEKKTPRGIKISKQYKKVYIGGQLMAIKGLRDDLPF